MRQGVDGGTVQSGPNQGSTPMNQNIRFCTTPDGVQLAYAISWRGAAAGDVRDLAHAS